MEVSRSIAEICEDYTFPLQHGQQVLAEICGDDESTRKMCRKTSNSWLVKLPNCNPLERMLDFASRLRGSIWSLVCAVESKQLVKLPTRQAKRRGLVEAARDGEGGGDEHDHHDDGEHADAHHLGRGELFCHQGPPRKERGTGARAVATFGKTNTHTHTSCQTTLLRSGGGRRGSPEPAWTWRAPRGAPGRLFGRTCT